MCIDSYQRDKKFQNGEETIKGTFLAFIWSLLVIQTQFKILRLITQSWTSIVTWVNLFTVHGFEIPCIHYAMDQIKDKEDELSLIFLVDKHTSR